MFYSQLEPAPELAFAPRAVDAVPGECVGVVLYAVVARSDEMTGIDHGVVVEQLQAVLLFPSEAFCRFFHHYGRDGLVVAAVALFERTFVIIGKHLAAESIVFLPDENAAWSCSMLPICSWTVANPRSGI